MTLAVHEDSKAYADPVKARRRNKWDDPERYLGFTAPGNWHTSHDKLSVLYMIRSGAFIKVGIAADLNKRLDNYRLHNPHELSVICRRTMPRPLARQVEKRVHQHLAVHVYRGEWFHAEFDTKAAIAFAAKQIDQARKACARWHVDGFGTYFEEEVLGPELPLAAE